jgi:hypothetical protein
MGWPPGWGFIYWGYFHASAMSYRGKNFTPVESKNITTYQTLTFQMLPCPACRFHALSYVSKHPMNFKTGDEFWVYMVDFHNAVNQRTKKLQVSYVEAEDLLADKLMNVMELKLGDLDQAFLQDYWNVLVYATYTFSTTPENPTEKEQQRLKSLLKAACYTLPFWNHIMSDGSTVRDQLLAFTSDDKNLNLTSRDQAIQTITNMHNVVCAEFNVTPKSLEDITSRFMILFDSQNYSKLIRAHEIREEDHKKMMALQQEVHGINVEKETTENYWKVSTVILTSILVLLAIFLTGSRMSKWKRKINLKQKLVTSGSSLKPEKGE